MGSARAVSTPQRCFHLQLLIGACLPCYVNPSVHVETVRGGTFNQKAIACSYDDASSAKQDENAQTTDTQTKESPQKGEKNNLAYVLSSVPGVGASRETKTPSTRHLPPDARLNELTPVSGCTHQRPLLCVCCVRVRRVWSQGEESSRAKRVVTAQRHTPRHKGKERTKGPNRQQTTRHAVGVREGVLPQKKHIITH